MQVTGSDWYAALPEQSNEHPLMQPTQHVSGSSIHKQAPRGIPAKSEVR